MGSLIVKQQYLENNECYKIGRIIKKPVLITLHSTATPGVMADRFAKSWNVFRPNGKQVCVHGFIDDTKLIQTLPWNMRGWHGGSGKLGSVNNLGPGIEICEPAGHTYNGGTMVGYNIEKNQNYFNLVYENVIDMCVMLCRELGLDATAITCHSEAYREGLASNHGDIEQWFPKHGKSMNQLRADINTELLYREDEEDMVKRFQNIEEIPNYAKEVVELLVRNKIITGTDKGLDLTEDMLRQLVFNSRAGLYNHLK